MGKAAISRGFVSIIIYLFVGCAAFLYPYYPHISISIFISICALQASEKQENLYYTIALFSLSYVITYVVLIIDNALAMSFVHAIVIHIIIAFVFILFISKFRLSSKKEQYKTELLNEVFDNSREAIFLVDFYTKRVVDCNQRALDMFEYEERESIIGQTAENIISNNISEQELEECRKQIALKGWWETNVYHNTQKGNRFWANILTSPLQVKKNKYYLSRITDITEKVERKQDVEFINSELNKVINAIDSVVYSTVNLKKGGVDFDYISEQIEDVYGLTKEEYKEKVKNDTLIDLVHPDDKDLLINAKRNLGNENQSSMVVQCRMLQPMKNKYVWIEEKVFPRFNAKGEHIGSFGVGTNVTLRKEYENSIKEREERYRTLFERNLAGVYKTRISDSKLLECNDALAGILGYDKKEDILGKQTKELYKKTEENFEKTIIEKKTILNQERKLKLNNEEEIWILENSRVVESYGKPSYIEGTIIEITALKHTQEALKESEEKLSIIVKSLDEIIYNTDLDNEGKTQLKYISPQIEKITGIDLSTYEAHLQEENFLSLVHPNDINEFKNKMDILDTQKKSISLCYRIKNQKTGNFHWVEDNIYPKIEEGKIIAKFGIIRDVTQDKYSEEALKLSEKRYKGLFERNMAGVFRIAINGDIIECNDSFANILGYEPEALTGIKAKKLYYNNTSRKKFLEELKKNDILTNYEISLKRADGEEVWCLLNSTFIRELEIIEGTLIDISELKITAEALIESEEALSSLLDKLPGMAFRYEINKNWRMEFISDGCYDLTGYQPEELMKDKGFNFIDIIKDEFKLEYKNRYNEIHKEGKRHFVFEYQILHKSGETRWLWEKANVANNENGEPTHLEGFIIDITARKEYETYINSEKEEYQSLLDYSPYPIVIQQKGQIKYLNQKGYELIELDVDITKINERIDYREIIKERNLEHTSVQNYVPIEYHEELERNIVKLYEGKQVPYIETQMVTLKQNLLDVEVRSTVVSYQGAPAVQIVIMDQTSKKRLIEEQGRAQAAEQQNKELEKEITEHQITQKRLLESKNYAKNLIESSLDIIIGTDINENINEINQSGLDKFGYEKEEIIGKKPDILYSDNRMYTRVINALEANGTFIGEVENIDKNGRVFSSILSSSIIKDQDGKALGAMGISRDITEIRDVEKIISQQSSTIKSIFESNSNMLILIVDNELKYVSFNKSYMNVTNLLLGEQPNKGQSMIETLKPHLLEDVLKKLMLGFERAMKGANETVEIKMKDRRGNWFWLELYLCPIILEDGCVNEIACLAHEVTDKRLSQEKIKESLHEKEILLKEVHHRVKNNLQVISSILNLQSAYVEDQNTLNILRESQNRIKSMSFIHESLYQTKNFSSINFTEYIINLAKNLVHTYQIKPGKIHQEYNMEEITLDLDQAIPCGLIVNELVSNALKYAFSDNEDGNIKIDLSEKENVIALSVEDNGKGLPKGFNPDTTNTLGLQLVVTLVEQLDGNMELKSVDGTKYLITFDRQTHNTHG